MTAYDWILLVLILVTLNALGWFYMRSCEVFKCLEEYLEIQKDFNEDVVKAFKRLGLPQDFQIGSKTKH